MRTLANAAYTDSVTDEVFLAGNHTRLRLMRLSVNGGPIRVTVKVGAGVLIDQDFGDGAVLTEGYGGGYEVRAGENVTVSTVGTGTTRITVLGD